MQYCRGGKVSKLFLLGSDFTDQIFTGELSGVDSDRGLNHATLMNDLENVPISFCMVSDNNDTKESKTINVNSFKIYKGLISNFDDDMPAS